jgi:hypothetical protein
MDASGDSTNPPELWSFLKAMQSRYEANLEKKGESWRDERFTPRVCAKRALDEMKEALSPDNDTPASSEWADAALFLFFAWVKSRLIEG